MASHRCLNSVAHALPYRFASRHASGSWRHVRLLRPRNGPVSCRASSFTEQGLEMRHNILRPFSGHASGSYGVCRPYGCQSIRRMPACRPSRLVVDAAAAASSSGPKKPGKRERSRPLPGDNGVLPPQPHTLQPKEEIQDVLEFEDEYEDEGALAAYMSSVVKVFCVHTEPNYSMPWQRKRQYTSFSSGFIASTDSQRWLLTNAHSVDYHTQVKVKKRGDDRKYIAKVLSIGVDCDVALLTVEDNDFWEGVTAVDFGALPRLQDSVAVVGYPVGGDTISVTAGVVSRIEVTNYSHGSTDLLGVQIDAAINSGNSGGPVFNRFGQCVGIAFQSLVGGDVENVGYVIPTPVVNHFLVDYQRHGTFTGFPALGLIWQRLESSTLRRAYKMQEQQKGILIRTVNPTAYTAGILRKDDIITHFDGVEVANDGTVPFRTGERIAFSYLVSLKFVGDPAVVSILRDGKPMTLEVRLSKPAPLVPPHINNRDPSFFVVAGLVFTPCCAAYLESEFGHDFTSEAPVKLLERMFYGLPEELGEEVVVLNQVLACEATLGYEEANNMQVQKFNGVTVRNLRQLAQLVINCRAEYMRFDLDFNEVIILDTQLSRDSTVEVMGQHCLPSAMSPDLKEVLPAWPALPGSVAAEQPAEAVSAATAS